MCSGNSCVECGEAEVCPATQLWGSLCPLAYLCTQNRCWAHPRDSCRTTKSWPFDQRGSTAPRGSPAAPDSPSLPKTPAHILALYLSPTPQGSPQPAGDQVRIAPALCWLSLPHATMSSPSTEAPPSLLTFLSFGLVVPLFSLVLTPRPLPVSPLIVFLPSPPLGVQEAEGIVLLMALSVPSTVSGPQGRAMVSPRACLPVPSPPSNAFCSSYLSSCLCLSAGWTS